MKNQNKNEKLTGEDILDYAVYNASDRKIYDIGNPDGKVSLREVAEAIIERGETNAEEWIPDSTIKKIKAWKSPLVAL